MKNLTVHTGTIHEINRMHSSHNGNPRFMITVMEPGGAIHACTTPDSSYGYSVKNLRDGDSVEMVVGTHYGVQSIHSIKKV